MNLSNKSVVLFLEDDNFFECHVLSKNVFATRLERYLYNNILIGSQVNSFTIDNSGTYNLFNRDLSYLKNVFEIIVSKYGNIDEIMKRIPSCQVYKEADLKKIYNINTIPQPYKLLNLPSNYTSIKYYTKFTSATKLIITILSICALYDLQFSITIQLQTHLYKLARISFEDI